MRRTAIAALVALGILAAGRAALAQDSSQIAVNTCQGAVVRELRGPRPEADSIRFTPTATSTQSSSAEITVTGTGLYFETGNDLWKSFSFKCTYNVRSGETYGASVRVGPAVKSLPPPTKSGSVPIAVKVCQSAIGSEVRNRFSDAVLVQFSSGANQRQQSSAEMIVSGDAQFQSDRFVWRSFSYQCTYNTATGETSGLTISASDASRPR